MQEIGRTEFTVGDIFRKFGQAYELSRPMSIGQRRSLEDIANCRTASLGGHLDECGNCGTERISYNSCGNITCPMCQGMRRRKWLEARMSELLPVSYFHCIFTLPHELNELCQYNQNLLYNLLLKSSSKTLIDLSRKYHNATPAILATLHTWGQNLSLHPHAHILVTSGGLSKSGEWHYGNSNFLFDVYEMSAVFKSNFLLGLRKFHKKGLLKKRDDFEGIYQQVEEHDWVVNCQKPFAGAGKVVEYLGRYVYRSAIANSRIKGVDDSGVSFDYKDYRDLDEKGVPKHKIMKPKPLEFIRRFLQHVLPKGFHRCRFYGIFAGSKRKENLQKCLQIFEEKLELLKEREEEAFEKEVCPNCGCSDFKRKAEILKERSPPIIVFHGFKRIKHA